MNPRPRLAALVAVFAFSALAVDPRLMRPILGDPSRMYGYSQPKWHNVATLFMPGGHDAVTAVAWARMRAPASNFADIFRRGTMFGDCTTEAARATAEGGATLTDLLGDAYTGTDTVPLSGDGRQAFADLLPTYDCPPGLAGTSWQYGCYCINLSTDTPLTLTVGGAEINVPEATNMVRNVQAVSADRSVTLTTGLAGRKAKIHFGIAVQPLHQFYGGVTPQRAYDDRRDLGDWFVVTNEYAMLVFRARIIESGAKVVTAWDAMTGAGVHVRSICTNAVDTIGRTTFAHDARLRLHICTMIPGDVDNGTDVWGIKGWTHWMSDAMLERVWEQDKAEMQRRGMDPWWRSP